MTRAVALTLLALAPSAARADKIEYTADDGKRAAVSGTIENESREEVVIANAGGQEQTVPVYQIDSVTYDTQTPGLINARARLNSGLYDQAIPMLETELAELPQGAKSLRLQTLYELFAAAAGAAIADPADPAEADEAVTRYEALQAADADNRHYYAAQRLLGRVHLAKGDYDKAKAAFETLQQVQWPGYDELAQFLLGLTGYERKDWYEATSRFDRVLASSGTSPLAVEQKRRAMTYKGETQLADGKPEEAVQTLAKAVDEIPKEQPALKAHAFNAYGDALAATGVPAKRTLLDAYLKVVTVYNADPEQVARALLAASKQFRAMGDNERADRLAADLLARFPQSRYARQLKGG